MEKQNRDIEHIVAVPGSDGGTFRNRVFPADLKNSFVAKTGTLTNVSTLAGAMSTQKGYSFFGIFNQNPNVVDSKNVQNIMVQNIMKDLGGPSSFDYKFENFYTYNRNEEIKNILIDENMISNFLPFEMGLN
jgi:D-alanyl-D-alanine carboxypeptidase/D-alanyl-D-alanine-endopeptidase (penicillin-binding protein 4)